jgi:hypothetical protein
MRRDMPLQEIKGQDLSARARTHTALNKGIETGMSE